MVERAFTHGYIHGQNCADRISAMSSYSVAVAKNTLPSLIDKALAGEEVVITRHGKPVAELRGSPPVAPRSGTATLAWLIRRTEARKPVAITSVELLEQMYAETER